MSNLTIGNPSLDQLLAMGDGLLRAGELKLAAGVYDTALKRAPKDRRSAIRMRLGIAQQPGPRAIPTFEVLAAASKIYARDAMASYGLATWFKTSPYLEDERFLGLVEKHAGLLPIPNWHWNLQTALWATQEAAKAEGDYVELGVFKGHTTLFCAEYLGFADWPRRWWLYDTFTGIPEDQLDPGFAESNGRAYNPETFTYEEVRDRFAPFPNIDVIQGRVPDILHDGVPAKIAFLHIDMNNAAAEIAALDFLFDRVSPGGIILFDDYGWSNAEAQRNAETAWFAARDERILPLPTGQGLYIKRGSSTTA
jgi:hypothetical protein